MTPTETSELKELIKQLQNAHGIENLKEIMGKEIHEIIIQIIEIIER